MANPVVEQLQGRTIGIIGPGRLGASLAAALEAAALGPVQMAGRTDAGDVARNCGLVFLTVPDAAIAPLAGRLPWRAGQWVVHCSGAMGLDALPAVAVAVAGAVPGCLHPIQTFPAPGEGERFHGITCGIEAAEPLGGALEALVAGLGGRSVRLDGVDRARYHAAAVFASNDVVALMAAAVRAWVAAGLPEAAAREALAPLMLATASNVAGRELADALTGPVARGDIATVERHVAALAAMPDLLALYRALAGELLRLPLGHDAATMARLAAITSPEPPAG